MQLNGLLLIDKPTGVTSHDVVTTAMPWSSLMRFSRPAATMIPRISVVTDAAIRRVMRPRRPPMPQAPAAQASAAHYARASRIFISCASDSAPMSASCSARKSFSTRSFAELRRFARYAM